MESEITIDDRGAVVRVIGGVDLGVLRELVLRLAAHPRFVPAIPTVWDFSEAVGLTTLSADDLRRTASDLGGVRTGGGHPRIAIVAPGDADFGIARMFEGLTEPLRQAQVSVFRDFREASAWAFEEAAPSPGEP